VTSGKSPIAISSQFAQAVLSPDSSPDEWQDSINAALGLITDDIQRIAGRTLPAAPIVSGTHRAVMPASGQARVYAISDTATSGSTGGNYLALSATRNGTTPLTLTYDTRRTEVIAYRGGMYLGELTVSTGDVVTVAIAVTGAPTPVLTTANFSMLIFLKET
jgi:hypothetical protein